jgi:tryptophan synthase beta subunit
MKYTTISVQLKNAKGHLAKGIIVVRDNFIITTFSEHNLARQLFEADLKAGEDVGFNEDLNAYIKRYEGKKKDVILKELEEEMKSSGIILVKREELEDEKAN